MGTIARWAGGSAIIRDELGFTDWRRKRKELAPDAVAVLQGTSEQLGTIGTEIPQGPMEMQDLGATAQLTSEANHALEETFAEIEQEEEGSAGLPIRELQGLNNTLQTYRGELVNNLGKLTEIDSHIALEKQKLEDAGHEFSRRRVAERLRTLEDERSVRLEAAATTREALRSQISRIWEMISRIIHEDTTLAEWVRTLFREQGITVASILTALGMTTITTLVLALTGGAGAPTLTPPTPPDKGGVKEWVKKHLQRLGRVLTKLADKAVAALPGIIGSVVSWLLNLLAKTASWLAGNLWVMVLTVGSLLLLAARAALSA